MTEAQYAAIRPLLGDAHEADDPKVDDEEWNERVFYMFSDADDLFDFMSAMASVAREYPVC